MSGRWRFAPGSQPTAVAPHRCTCRCRCAPPDRLTDKELVIVAGLANGRRLDAIAAEIGHTEDTTATYVSRARKKLGARDRAHLVSLAFYRRLLEFGPDGVVGVSRRESVALNRAVAS